MEKVGTRDAVKAIKNMQCLAVSWDAELTDKELLPVSSTETTYETCACTHESVRFTHTCAHKSARFTHTCAHESARFTHKSKEKGEYNGYFQNVCVSLPPSRRTLQYVPVTKLMRISTEKETGKKKKKKKKSL